MDHKKHYIEIKDDRIAYTVIKTKRRTIGITVDRNGEVTVAVPFYINEKQIREIIQKKTDWIVKKVSEARERNSNTIFREFVNGEKLLYLGKEYTLAIVEKDLSKAEVHMQDDAISVYITQKLSEESRKQAIKETLIKWYRQRFTEIVKERIEKYSLQLKVTPYKVVIKNQKTIWGSCSKKGNINLNWRLVMAPIDIIDYVVIHELCHLRIMNHSKDFWNLVESILPDYYEKRNWLKECGNRLEL